MNEYSNSEFGTRAEPPVSLNPGTSLLIALGAGLLIGAIIHTLRPAPKPQQRLARLLADMEDRLREVSAPALHKVGNLAMNGAEALGSRVDRGEAQVEKLIRNAARRLRQLVP